MRLSVVGGMCNRLRAMLSYRSTHGPIDVVWQPDESVSYAHFLDVFERMPGITFVNPSGGWDVEAWDHAPGAPDGWKRGYAELRPKLGPVLTRIQDLARDMPRPFSAVHIRRTDHLPNCVTIGEPAPPVSEWIEWARGIGDPCYVATDNAVTQRTMIAALPLAVCGAMLPVGQEDRTTQERYGTLAEAVVDMWLCSYAGAFKGSKHSSFSETIEVMRGLR